MNEGSLELEVTDFGPIIQANIELRPFTVFVGQSNTGKSWIAVLNYALHRYFSEAKRLEPLRPDQIWRALYTGGANGPDHGRREARISRKHEEVLSGAPVDALLTWAKQELSDGTRMHDLFGNSQTSPDQKSFVIPEQITEPVEWIFNTQGGPLGHEIRRCFGVDGIDRLVRKSSKTGAQVAIRRHFSGDTQPFEHRLTIRSQKTLFETTVPEGIGFPGGHYFELKEQFSELISHLSDITHGPDIDINDPEIRSSCWPLISTIADFIKPYLFGPLNLRAFYLPADRTGVMHAHRVVVSALIEGATMAGVRPAARAPMLSGVLADFLEQLIEIDRPPYRHEESRNYHAAQIENAILGGAIQVSRAETTGYPRFTYQPEGWKDSLALMNASSMVSELAPVVLYLRYRVGPGNVLIVEEPELSLHPAMQVELIRQLAALVQSGIRVIITTHSEWVLEELANIVRRSRLPSGERDKLEHGDCALRSDQVGAWLFKKKNRPKGSVVEEVKLDDETGLYPTDYDEVSESLYNESVNIFNRIQDSKDE